MTITNTLNSYKILNGGKKFVEVEEKLPLLTDEQRRRELQEERIDIMAGEGMNEDEARFRVMTGKEPDDLDRKLGFDFIPYQLGEALTERENGYKIADDNETVEAVTIPDDALPEFKTRADLRNWLIGKFNEIGNVTIKSTRANVEFNKTGAQRAIKNARQKKNNIAYPEIEKVVSGAKYSGFREADERHQNVRGQDVYHSGVVYKGVPYSVEFYVDVPLEGNTGDNFAGNKISKMEIAPTETQVTSENQNRPANNLSGAISNISLAVLRGKVKPARYDASTSTYYQGKEVPIPSYEFYDNIKASPQYQDNIKYSEEVFDMVKADKHVVQADIDQSINRIGGQSTYIDGYFDNGVNFLIRISDHWSNYDLSHVSVGYGTDKNKILELLEYRRGTLDRAKEANRQRHIAFTELLKKLIPESYYQYADSKETFKELAKQGVIERPVMWGFNPEEQEKYGKLGVSWKGIEDFVKKKGDWAEEGVSSQSSTVNDGVKASAEENARPYSVRQVEKLLQNPQENEEVLLDLYDNHWEKYGANLKARIRDAVVYDLQKRDFRQTEEEKTEAKREAVRTEQANLKLPKKISLSALSKVIKDNGYPIVKQYTANTGSQYITVELDSATQDEIQISIRDHAKHSNDYVRPDYDLNIEYDNSWQEDFEKLADKLDLKGALVTKVKKYNELSRSLKNAEEQGEVYYQGQIADNAGAVELTINTAEETAGVSEDEFKQKMLDTLKSFKGNKIFNQSLGGEIEIRTSSIKKYKSFFADKNKRLIVPYIPELLAKARFTKEASYTKATEPNIKAYYKSDLPINIDNDLYNVHLTVREDQNGNFFWDAQIKESPQHAAPATNPGDTGAKAEQSAFEDSISLEKKEVNNAYYQSAFHGTPHNELEGGRFSLEKIGTGENASAHGYGLYYTSKFDIADLRYRQRLAQPYQKFVSFGDVSYNKKTKKYDNAFNSKSIEYEVYSDYIDAGKDYDTLIKSYKSLENINASIKDRIAIAKKYADKLDDAREFIDDSIATGQVYEVDLPENPYLLDEQLPVNQQSEHIRKAVRDIMNKYPDDYISSENYETGSFGDALTGGSFYKQLMFIAQRNGTSDKIEQMKFASKILEENGVKGITYDGRQDGRCFVIFNPDDVKVIQKFYQTGELGLDGGRGKAPFGAQAQSRKEKVIYQVFGQYEPAKKLITLFQGKNSTTLVHELLHHYLPIYLTELEKAGKFEQLKGLYEALGVQSYSDIARQRAKMEQLIDLGTSYIYYNESPNEASRSLFERAKQWMLDAYGIVKKFVKPSKEVDEFFNELFAREEENLPDIRDLKGKSAELAKILKGAASGQELTVNGLSLRDIANLRKTLYARIPRAGESLADAIRQAGGIDTESGLAKALGYDSRKGSDMGFWNYKGAINDESSLIDFLTANGYLNQKADINTPEFKRVLAIGGC